MQASTMDTSSSSSSEEEKEGGEDRRLSRRELVGSLLRAVQEEEDGGGGGDDEMMMLSAFGDEEGEDEEEGRPRRRQRPLDLCQELLTAVLSEQEDSNETETTATAGKTKTPSNPTSSSTVRSMLGNAPSSEVSALAESLAQLMAEDRVDLAELLPGTYDERGNLEAARSDHLALTLTRTSLRSAHLYAALVGQPGALGAGLVQPHALAALSALLRRWTMECCGRETEAFSAADSSSSKTKERKKKDNEPKRKGGNKNKKRLSDEVHRDENDDDDSDATPLQPLKRTRNRRPAGYSDSDEESDEGDDEDDGEPLVVLDGHQERDSNDLSSRDLVALGLAAAREIAAVPLSREFWSWSCEARDTVLDGVTSVLGTASALVAAANAIGGQQLPPGQQEKNKKGGDTIDLASLGRDVVARASASLTRCLVVLQSSDANKNDRYADSDGLTKRHETTKSILRGLLPLITAKQTLPKGQAGEQAAAAAASRVLAGLIQNVSQDLLATSRPQRRRGGRPSTQQSFRTPAKTPSDAHEKTTPKSTGNRLRRTRVSLGCSAETPGSTTILSPPKLKTPATAAARAEMAAGQQHQANSKKMHPILSVLVGMLQTLASHKEIERASLRSSMVETTLHPCLVELPSRERLHFVRFLVQLSHSKVPSHRQLASELVGRVLADEWLWEEHASSTTIGGGVGTPSKVVVDGSEDDENLPGALLAALEDRLVDRVPAIRVASANALAGLFRKVLEEQVGQSSTMKALEQALSPQAYMLAKRLRGRCVSDDKATVRKAALSALVELLLVAEACDSVVTILGDDDLIVLEELCCDASVLTRKAAAEALTRLLEWYSQNKKGGDNSTADAFTNDCSMLEAMETAWTCSVLPLALDSETMCVSKAVDLFDRVVLGPLLDSDLHDEEEDACCQTAWRILASVTNVPGKRGFSSRSSEADALRAVLKQKAIAANNDRNAVLGPVLKIIHQTCLDTLDGEDLFEPMLEARRSGAWSLFYATMGVSKDPSEITRLLKRKKIGLDFVGECWEKILHLFMSSSNQSGENTDRLRASMKHCLGVMSTLASGFGGDRGSKCSKDLERLLSNFSLPVDITGAAVRALTAVTAASNHDLNHGREACTAKIRLLLTACGDEIASQVGTFNGSEVGESPLVRALHTTGELCLVGFNETDDDNGKSTAVTQEQPLRGLYERPPKRLVDLVQAFLPDTLPGLNTNVRSPEIVRAHAFLALGKMCLRDEKLAEKSLYILARELHENMQEGGSTAVQSNALLILGDLCVRYTNLVDQFLPIMACCLQSGIADMRSITLNPAFSAFSGGNKGSALVRIHAIRLLSSLLIQDYIKWRGLLFHRFLVATSDDDDEVAATAEMVLIGPLLTKQPKLFSNHFVESLFVLNRCTAHPIYKAATVLGDGGSGIAVGFEGIQLDGEVGRARRRQMYELMLSRMTDVEKIEVTARIAKDVLGSALEGGSELNRVCGVLTDAGDAAYEGAYNVLSDAFGVLSNKNIRVSRSSGGGGGAEDEEQQGDPDNVQNESRQRVVAAKGRLLSRLSRKHLIEIVIPILVNLKALLQKRCSPLLKDLMIYLVNVYDVYKAEVKELLSNDPNLLQEIEYDARQFKKNNAQNQIIAIA